MNRIREMLEHRLETFPRMMSDADPKLICCMERFVLKFGNERIGVRFPHERHAPSRCFFNAANYALRYGLWYVEGYGELPGFSIPFHHAWAEDDKGNVYDPTWESPEGRHYMGVQFDPTVPVKRGLETREFCLLDSSVGPRFEFMEQETLRRAA